MKKNKTYNVALVVYTSSLDFDDRIRKEMVSIQKLYPNVKFKIFALYYENKSEEGITSYGVPYKVFSLKSRDKYKSNTHTFIKTWEFFQTVKPELKEFDAIWCADYHVFLFALLLHGKPMLWDLHELPFMFLNKKWGKWVFRFIERKMNVIIHANEPRLRYLQAEGMVKHPEKNFSLRNYPDFNEIDSEYDEKYHDFIKWLGDGKCVYLQGIQDYERADFESTCAVLEVDGLKGVIVGRTNENLRTRLEEKYGREMVSERLFFTGMIKQLKTPQYIRKCVMGLVFYKNVNANNWYCEPNRLFQNINNCIPVVVGTNPPMRELVEKYGVGVCADTDGCDQDKIIKAIQKILERYDDYKKKLEDTKGNWLWGIQEVTIKQIMCLFLPD